MSPTSVECASNFHPEQSAKAHSAHPAGARQWVHERAERGPHRPGCAATAAGRRTSRSRSTTRESTASTPTAASAPRSSTSCRRRSCSASTACTTSPTSASSDGRVEPIEDRWERMVAGTPWVASCTVTVDAGPGRDLLRPGGRRRSSPTAPSATPACASSSPTSASTSTTRSRSSSTCWSSSTRARAQEATEVLEEAAQGQLELTSLAEESRPPAHASDEAH